MAFNLKEHLVQLRDGKAELEKRRDSIQEQIAALTAELEDVDADLERIEGFDLDSVVGPAPTRMVGVLQLVENVALRILEDGGTVAENVIVEAVRKAEPEAKEGSIRSALGRLVDKGKIARSGKRGSHSYSLPNPTSDIPAPMAPVDLLDAVLHAIDAAGEGGISRSDLAWKLGDSVGLDDALTRSLQHGVEVADGSHYRRLPKPFGQRTLFQGADGPPEHANK